VHVVEQLIRPTGIIDPVISIRPTEKQIDDLLAEIRIRVEKNQRTLVTTLTKKMSEDLADYLQEMGVKVHYLHSEIDTIERVEILRDLRLGVYDVIVGINLLREGLDLPEVSLVIILDADKEGYLRSTRSLIQTMGRAARHLEGSVIMYADRITDSMQRAIDVALKIITLGGQHEYLTRYHTVFGDTLWVPSMWSEETDAQRYILLRHERVHLRQRRRYGTIGMALLYLLPIFPLGLALGRAKIEMEAYRETLRATAEVHGLSAARDERFVSEMIRRFTSGAYGWMWPFPKMVRRWIDEPLSEIASSIQTERRDEEPLAVDTGR